MITKDTKIKKLLNQNEEVIDFFRTINTELGKIEPLTYQMYAENKVMVKDLAKLGKINTNELLKQLEKFGFEVDYTQKSDKTLQDNLKEDEIDLSQLNIVTLDVRPTIAKGNDPFDEIMEVVKKLKPDESLQIINVFVPIPLVNLMKKKGYTTWTNTISDKEYHTFFTKDNIKKEEKKEDNENQNKGNFDDVLASFGSKVKEIDVRDLEMPEPMITILKEIENLPDDYVLLVNHKKIPQFLLPELRTRNYQWLSKKVDENLILFIVYK